MDGSVVADPGASLLSFAWELRPAHSIKQRGRTLASVYGVLLVEKGRLCLQALISQAAHPSLPPWGARRVPTRPQ